MTAPTVAPTSAPFGRDWVQAYFDEVDRMDPAALMRWYVDNASFRFANYPPTIGHDAIASVLGAFYATIRAMRHEMTGVWIDEAAPSAVWEAIAHFEMPDGRHVALPAVSVLRLRDGLIHDFRFVMDATPVQGNSGA